MDLQAKMAEMIGVNRIRVNRIGSVGFKRMAEMNRHHFSLTNV